MKATPFSFISFLLLLVWSAIAQGAAIPNSNIQSLDVTDSPALIKRGCVPSKTKKNDWDCTDESPSVAELVKKVKDYKQVGHKDSLFYNNLKQGSAIPRANAWYKANVKNGRGAVTFNQIVDQGWYNAQLEVLAKGGYAKGDVMQKRLSQAFAEVSDGTVYFFGPKNADGTKIPENTAWGGWEYPALTRNPHVDQIIQVNFQSDEGIEATTKVIWKKGDPKSPKEPRG